ncbi:hypothetical protein DXB83_01255 [Blautia sp. OM06-15AC]|nr:hypothetical protein DXB83_01255 [Blautia sp. OM06-15AC]
MQGIFQKENTDKALKYGIYRHLPTYEKIIRNLVSFFSKNFHFSSAIPRTIRPDHPQKSLDNPAHVFYIEAIMDDFFFFILRRFL